MMKRHAFLSLLAVFFVSLGCSDRPDASAKDAYAAATINIADTINADFRILRLEVENLARTVEGYYASEGRDWRNSDTLKYQMAKTGVFYKTVDDGGSAVFVSGAVPITQTVRDIVFKTAPIDSALVRIVSSYKEAVQVYYNDKHSYNRIYPYFDVLTQYEPGMNIPDFNFYYLAAQQYNPSRSGVWVAEPYVDPAGRGWMVSAIAPVYFRDSLVGVPGIDITISTIVDRYIQTTDKSVLIVDSSGTIVAAAEDLIYLFDMPPLRDHKYSETVKDNTYRPDQYNIRRSPKSEIRDLAEAVLRKRVPVYPFESNGKKYTVYSAIIKELNWTLLLVV